MTQSKLARLGGLILLAVNLYTTAGSAQDGSVVTQRQTQPSPVPVDLKAEAKRVFKQGMPYFIWSATKDQLQFKGNELFLEIGLRFAVNPEVKTQPFQIRTKVVAQNKYTGEPVELSNLNQGLGALSKTNSFDASIVYGVAFNNAPRIKKGEGTATIDLILLKTEDPKNEKSISNRITVRLVFSGEYTR